MKRFLEIYTDGACSGNPGPAGVGVVIIENNETIKEISMPIGAATNNIAEYTALIYALQEELVFKATDLNIYSDSELMCKQVLGQYQVKNEALKPHFDQVSHLLCGFKHVELRHVLRAQNKQADKLATSAIKKANKDGCLVI